MARETHQGRSTMAPKPWLLPLLAASSIILIALFASTSGEPETDPERVQRLTETFACPECDGQSVAESNAAVAANISRFISAEVAAGSTDDQIRDALVASWGQSVLLTPASDGIATWLWVTPVVVLGLGLVVLLRLAVIQDSAWSNRRWLLYLLAVGATLVITGFVLAGFLGERGVNDEITGAINRTPGQRISECTDLANSGDITGGISCLDGLLAADPDNSFIIANKGWLFALTARAAEDPGQIEALNEFAIENLDKAIELRSSNRDAIAWRAIAHDWQGNEAQACADLEELYSLSPTSLMIDLTADLSSRCQN